MFSGLLLPTRLFDAMCRGQMFVSLLSIALSSVPRSMLSAPATIFSLAYFFFLLMLVILNPFSCEFCLSVVHWVHFATDAQEGL